MTIIKSIEEYANSTGDYKLSNEFINFIKNTGTPFSKDNKKGHITASAWIVSRNFRQTLLTHHKKLNIWIQTGGHCEGEMDPVKIAMREGEEETGLKLEILDRDIFSLDIHNIPAYGSHPTHKHYDITYIFTPLTNHNYTVSRESFDLKWVDLKNLEYFTKEKNILSMGLKTRNLIKSNYISILNS